MLLQRLSGHIRSQNWFAVVVDFFIVVLGIFVGLQVTNWNEARKARIEETALLVSLAADFDESRRLLAEVTQSHQLVADAGQAILDYAQAGGVPKDERERFENLLASHASRFLFVPPMGTVSSLLGTDRINLIGNQELIAELTRWPQLVAALNEAEFSSRDDFHERLIPYLSTRINLEKSMRSSWVDCCFTPPNLLYRMEYPWAAADPTDAYRLLEDQEFQNLIYWHWVLSLNMFESLWPLEDALDRIQALISEELDG